MGWFSRVRHPWVREASLFVWQLFAGDLRLHEAREDRFDSMHDCFIRRLKPGARPIDRTPQVLVSPCDGIVGAFGTIRGTQVFQAKGYPYALEELLSDTALVARFRDGVFVTLRLKANMYHRFHAPADCRLTRVNYIAGDTWNVNPIALKRVEKLFCRNERAALELDIAAGDGAGPAPALLLVPVAAILVASIRLHALPHPLNLRCPGNNRFHCNAAYRRGEEMGYFEQGSTILVFASRPARIHPDIREGCAVRLGQALLLQS